MNRSPGAATGRSSYVRSSATARPSNACSRSRSGRRPETCASNCPTVMRSLPRRAKAGRYSATGARSRTRPSSTSIITAVVVATTFVSEARSKIVSTVIGSLAGSTARRPNAFRYAVWPRLHTSTTAPGRSPSAIAASTAPSMRLRRSKSIAMAPSRGTAGLSMTGALQPPARHSKASRKAGRSMAGKERVSDYTVARQSRWRRQRVQIQARRRHLPRLQRPSARPRFRPWRRQP